MSSILPQLITNGARRAYPETAETWILKSVTDDELMKRHNE